VPPPADPTATLAAQLMTDAARVRTDTRFSGLVPVFTQVISQTWAALKRAGMPVDDSGGFSVATYLVVVPVPVTERELTRHCGLMKLASRKRVRALVERLQSARLIEQRRSGTDARRLALQATPELRALYQRWIVALAELVEPWSGIDRSRVDDALVVSYLRVTAQAYEQGYVLYQGFPIVEYFMSRRSGYSLFLELIGRTDTNGSSSLNRARFATEHGTSRPHVATLLREAEQRGWIRRRAKDDVWVTPAVVEEGQRWIASEIAWTSYSLRLATRPAALSF
jgi:hypothetical protein